MLVCDQIITLAVLANAACQSDVTDGEAELCDLPPEKKKALWARLERERESDIALEDDPGLCF